MSGIGTDRPQAPTMPSRIPPLQNGDRLTRAEFERRYDATPGIKKAELIEGVVYMAPPAVPHTYHSAPHARLMLWLGTYCSETPGVLFGDNGSLRLDLDNMPQPDAYAMIEGRRGGQAHVDEDHYVAGAPELVGEVAASSVSYDLHIKLPVYRRNLVREYIVWRTEDGELDYFALRDGEYKQLNADPAGIIKSAIFPGLWLDRNALLVGDLKRVIEVVQQGCATADHAEFLNRLTQNLK